MRIGKSWLDIQKVLYPFYSITKRLEGEAVDGHHGSVWEGLPAIEFLIDHLDKMKIYTQKTSPKIATGVNLAWAKLDEYYKKLDDTPAYAAALFLHPRF